MTGALARDLDAAAAAERRRAVRLLLRRPFVTAAAPDPEGFVLVRRHAPLLQAWFAENLGYRLVVETGFARLHKVRGTAGDRTRPARTRTGTPFDPRRYALLCLVLAALERAEGQTTLSFIASEAGLLAASTDGVDPLDLDRQSERRAFVDAVRLVCDYGALRHTDGEEDTFIKGDGDVLYDVDRRLLAQLLSSPVPPSLAGTMDRMTAEDYPDTDAGRTRRARHTVFRRLVEEPVCYLDDLDEAARAYLTSQRRWLADQLETHCGLSLEIRREGCAGVDPDDWLTDVHFPAPGTVGHAALLLSDELVRHTREREDRTVTRSALRELMAGPYARHAGRWARDYAGTEGVDKVVADALDRLESFDLVRSVPEGVRVMPALARFRPDDEPGSAEPAPDPRGARHG